MARLSQPFSLLVLLLYLCFQVLATDSLGITRDRMSESQPGWTSYSSLLEIDKNAASVSDKQLNDVCKQAYEEMEKEAKKDGLKGVPGVMTALAVGNKIYLGSSMKGRRGYWYEHDFEHAPEELKQGLQACEAAGKTHRTGGGCGEINAIALAYELEKTIQLKGGKITSWGRDPQKNEVLFRQACGRPPKDDPDTLDWGCWKITGYYEMHRVSRKETETPNFSFKVISSGRAKCST